MLLRAAVVAVAIAAQLGVLGVLHLAPLNFGDIGLEPPDLLNTPLLVTLAAAAVLGVVLYGLLRKGYERVAAVAAALGCYIYLQFYFLVPDLGSFDGRAANFSGHSWFIAAEFTLAALLLTFALARPKTALSILAPATGFLALAEGALVTRQALAFGAPRTAAEAGPADLVNPIFYETSLGRTEGMPDLSRRNVILIVVDTMQGDIFKRIIGEQPAIAEAFSGFTFYEDAAGGFPFTGLSVLSILTGTRYDGTESIPSYQKRIAPLQLAARMDALGYAVDLLPLNALAPFVDRESQHCRRLATLYNLALLRQLPTVFKSWQYNDSKFRLVTELCGAAPATRQETDPAALHKLTAASAVTRTDKPSFKFMHLYGMHPPSLLRKDCSVREKASKEPADTAEQGQCVLTKLSAYLARLKQLGVYDDSMIVVTADHGTLFGPGFQDISGPGIPSKVISAAHPAVLFKDFKAEGPLRNSSAPVTLLDIFPTVLKRAGGDPRDAQGLDLAAPIDGGRVREFLYFRRAAEIGLGNYLKNEFWFTILGPALDPASWHLSPAPKDGKTVRLPDPWITTAGARILAPPAPSGRLTFEAEIETVGQPQTLHLSVNGRAVASWDAPPGKTTRKLDMTLEPDERDRRNVVFIRSTAPEVAIDDGKRLKTLKAEEASRASGVRMETILLSQSPQ